jgi:phytoene desaturase
LQVPLINTVGVNKLVYKPIVLSLNSGLATERRFKLSFSSISKHIAKYFQSQAQADHGISCAFPGVAAGYSALYSLMNYADIKGGTCIPGSMYAVVQAMYKLALELGVEFKFGESVNSLMIKATGRRP